MSDAIDNSEEEPSAGEPVAPVGGERLAEARRAQQIPVHEIAKELHLDEPKVRALERNEFDVLGAPVFAKGHLRKYAKLVQVNEDDVMADYYQLNRAAGVPPVIAARPRPRREMSPGPWIAVIVVIIVTATAYWYFTSPSAVVEEPSQDLMPRESLPAPEPETLPPASDPEAIPVEDPEAMPVEDPEAAAADDDDSAVLQSALDTEETAVAEGAPTTDPGDGQMQMLITYSGDCWTEISDAEGRRLFFGLGTDGRTVELSGEAPFNVLFGDAANVSIRVNGTERLITAAERRGNTARLTVSGP